MLDSLHFVKGAVSKKDFVPALTHFRIKDGRITGYNGKLSLSAPIALDIDCCPKALPFVKALEACSETIQLHMTPAGKLALRSGTFRALVESLPEDMYPDVTPEGIRVDTVDNGGLLNAMAVLYEFMAEDASRPWSNGMLLNGESAFATNNVVLAEYWLGCHFPYRINVPRYAIKEMIRIGEEPEYMQVTETSITFFYEGDRWLKSQLIGVPWPDATKLFERLPTIGSLPPVPEGLFEALATIEPFTDDLNRAFLTEGMVSTGPDDTAAASVDVPGLAPGVYNLEMFRRLEGVATALDLTHYPAPLPWYGNRVRGLFMGMRA